MKPEVKQQIDVPQNNDPSALIKPIIQVEMTETLDNSTKTGPIKTKKKKKKKKKSAVVPKEPSEIIQQLPDAD